MALVAQLVGLHGGAITADSAPQVGTTFTVTLPLGSAHLPADQIAPASPVVTASETAAPFVEEAPRWLPRTGQAPDGPARPGSAAVESSGAARDGRVLIVDDNADMREYLAHVGARYHVQTVADGVAALDAATAQPPDVLVSDVMMPRMDGLQLLAALRADVRTMRMPVLLLSARAGQESAIQGLAAGADDYLVKPFTAQELLAGSTHTSSWAGSGERLSNGWSYSSRPPPRCPRRPPPPRWRRPRSPISRVSWRPLPPSGTSCVRPARWSGLPGAALRRRRCTTGRRCG